MNKLIYDIGMNGGEDTDYYLARGYNVVAIEADPDSVEYCTTQFKEYIDSGRLVIVNGAIVQDDTQKEVTFFRNLKHSVLSTVSDKWAARNAQANTYNAPSQNITVPVVNFSNILEKYPSPYYVKIDIEGMDFTCLQQLAKTQFRPSFVSIESDKVSFDDLLKEFDLLHEMGYDRFIVQQQEEVRFMKVPTDTNEGDYVDYTFDSGSSGMFGSDLGTTWLSKDQAIQRYRAVFEDYEMYGDNSYLRTRQKFHIIEKKSHERGVPYELPGWYDTHAMHSSVQI